MSRLFAQSLRTAVRDVARQPTLTRSFSSLPTLRPSTSTPASIFARRPTTLLQTSFTPTTTATATTAEPSADLVPTSAISSHPALLQTQIRCGPRRYMNMNRPSRLIRNRRVGFLTRMKSKDGRKMIARRKAKGRKRLGAA